MRVLLRKSLWYGIGTTTRGKLLPEPSVLYELGFTIDDIKNIAQNMEHSHYLKK